ncbi:nucleotidyltransferase domain-containing protein [Devosia sp. A16]|uniref:nucleotidyltransferase domain-containing protein n=1 Tax=Devosia sp. A16 TaxID=1736675 RepID=UPI0006D7BAC5|nr:nucleotidyltransferase domain-containing protein [Devosia sp. A16]
MDQSELIARVVDSFGGDPRITALFLSGSFGRGTADAHSDVDLLAIADPADHEGLAGDWRPALEAITPIVHYVRLPHALVLNAVTDDWLRIDLHIAIRDHLANAAQDSLKPLVDRHDLYATLRPETPEPARNPGRLGWMVGEFIRILGLTPVAIGRGEVELMTVGNGFLRRLLTDLLIMEVNPRIPGGMLHLSRVLDPGRMAVLASVPLPQLDSNSAIASNLALARTFMPRAKALCTTLGVEWPTAFEAATRRNLQRALPDRTIDW